MLLLAGGLLTGTAYAKAKKKTTETTEQTAQPETAGSKEAAKWVKKEMADAKKAIALVRKVKDSSSCRSASADLKKLVKPYEEFYGASSGAADGVKLNLPPGVKGPGDSVWNSGRPAANLPGGLKLEDVQAEQRRCAKQRRALAEEMKKAHDGIGAVIRASYSTCGHAPTTDIDTKDLDAAAFFVQQHMCSVPE